jgi:hypothetical protein
MGALPEQLYLIWGSRKQGVIPRIWQDRTDFNDVGLSIEIDGTIVPEEYDLVVTHVFIKGVAAVGNIKRLLLVIDRETGVNIPLDEVNFGAGTRDRESLSWQGEIWVPAGANVQGSIFYSVSNAGNTGILSSYGWLVPRMEV